MARAKRTDRTEARRRHRAEQADVVGLEDGDEAAYPSENAAETPRRKGTAPATAKSSSAVRAAPAPVPQRPSFTDSARRAFRPANIREDLPYLPKLLIHWSVLLSVGLALAGTLLLVTQGTAGGSASVASGSPAPTISASASVAPSDTASQAPSSSAGPTASEAPAPSGGTTTTTLGYIGGMLFSLFVGLPPFGAALLMGFMLPRATYLIGVIYGLFAYVLLIALYLTQPALTGTDISLSYYLSALGLMVVGTMFFTSGIAWYRRFLDLLNPARAQRQQAIKKAQAQGRGNAPRNRLSGRDR